MPRKKDKDSIPSDYRDLDTEDVDIPSDIELTSGSLGDTTTKSMINEVLRRVGGTARKLTEEVLQIGWKVRTQLQEDAYVLGYKSVYDYLEDLSQLFIEYNEVKDLTKMKKEYEIKLKILDYLIKELQDLITSYDKMFKLLIVSSNRQNLNEIYQDLRKEINEHLNLINSQINLLYNEPRHSTGQVGRTQEEGKKLNKSKE
ncbi:hypothetical protein [Caldisphaera sp.]|uniref:hypothetical protein n=1 Tax=Caldisphaera sp. TaxID=2060322 RepID=UPI0025BA53EB|nr:hypothetical protein [Caldisphaera sp.]